MAAQGVALGLSAIPLATQHYDKVRDPVQREWQKARGRVPREDPDLVDNRAMEDKGYVLRKRSEIQPDEEIVEVVRHRGEVLPRRPRHPRRPSSMDGLPRGGGERGGRYHRDTGGYGSESEGSVPPRSRARARSTTGKSRTKGRRGSSSSSSSSSSELGSTSGEEKEMKKMQRKKWITAAFASVATIHAASKVYGSIENHDKRIIEVEKGTLSPEEAHKRQRRARWQDAAAIGLAALGIKGAISEWHEVQEEHQEHCELKNKSVEHHKKRLERLRRERAREQGGYYKGRDGHWYYDGPMPQSSESQRSRSQATSSRDLDGPRQNSRRAIEGRPSHDRDRDHSVYGDRDRDYDRARSKSRARSTYGRDDSPDSRDYKKRSSPDRRRVSTYDDRY